MEKYSILEQLMMVRMDSVLGEIVEKDAVYLAAKDEASDYCAKLDAMHLPGDAMLLIDRYVGAQTANGSRYGELAYMLGFSDCAELLLGRSGFPCIKGCAAEK